MLMTRRLSFILSLVTFAVTVSAQTNAPQGPKQKSSTATKTEAVRAVPNDALLQSANGWTFVKGEWVHPDGYKLSNGRILRTTARPGKAVPQAPGKLALENPQKLTPTAIASLENASRTAADKAATDKAAEKARNLAPRAAPQTGSNLF